MDTQVEEREGELLQSPYRRWQLAANWELLRHFRRSLGSPFCWLHGDVLQRQSRKVLLETLESWKCRCWFFRSVLGIRELPCASASRAYRLSPTLPKSSKALATLVIPFWPSSSFWPLIANNVPMLLLCKVTFSKMVVVLSWEKHKFPFGIEIFPWASCRHQVLFSFQRERKIG